MKIFLDSSVIIAALLSETGGSAKIMSLCETGLFEGYISQEVIKEIHTVLQRKLPGALPLFEKLIFSSKCKKITLKKSAKTKEAQKWIRDPFDVHVLLAAKQIPADYLITLDIKHFIRDPEVAKKSGLIILTPGDFLQQIFPR